MAMFNCRWHSRSTRESKSRLEQVHRQIERDDDPVLRACDPCKFFQCHERDCVRGFCRILKSCRSNRRSYKSYWRMRNDSGGVGGVLCPDYFRSGRTTTGKLAITSKRQESQKLSRKPVKECYCYSEANKNRSGKISEESSLPCAYCKSSFVIAPVDSYADTQRVLVGDETARKVEKITYSPTSEFLRRVQEKVSSRKNKKKQPSDDRSEFSTSSSRSRRCSTRTARDSGRGESATEIRRRIEIGNARAVHRVRPRSESNYESGAEVDQRRSTDDRDNVQGRKVDERSEIHRASLGSSCCRTNDRGSPSLDEKEAIGRDKSRQQRGSMKKCIRPADGEAKEQRKPPRVKRIVRTISAHGRCCANENIGTPSIGVESRRMRNKLRDTRGTGQCPEVHSLDTSWQLSRDKTRNLTELRAGDSREKIRDTEKYRRENYFETHGSTHSLLASSGSSGSLEQYELNDRLFPEPVRRIRRDDIVVTMPPCATKQCKRIHYFPRRIVDQEKSIGNANYKKKRRSQSCGLTGHAIDLGIFKIPRDPTNSLALKYQKGVVNFDK